MTAADRQDPMTAPTPFRTLLVANRGEIALRVMRSARAMGLATVAVHSRVDAGAPHVRAADKAVCIGEALPRDSYLNIGAIIAAARASGADAVHPGYGFLAENAAFAQAVIDAGLVWVGPPPAAIRAMGDKAGAKQRMQAAGVPCIPGYDGDDQTDARLLAEARALGAPLMVKASAGGGGRGMRLVHDLADFMPLLRSAQSEALGAFGDSRVILESALIEPRHIEIQVLADGHGRAIHLGERDCSVQRRHQKVVEEAPSPAVDAALRQRMGDCAVRAVQAIGYQGAGTLEFLLAADGAFYFMEMNTRLQVEHPVTEAITGLDLVALQFQVAAGEALPLTQDQVRFEGHAIEVRLCAEDPGAQFLPQSGTLGLWRPSALLRVEHALEDGSVVPPYYDSMLAKLIAHGRTRDEARARLLHGLADTVALGLPTNQAFLSACLRHAEFATTGATTGFVPRQAAELTAAPADDQARVLALVAALAHAAPEAPLQHRYAVPVRLQVAGAGQAIVTALLQRQPGRGVVITLGGIEHMLQLQASDPADPNDHRFVLDGVAHRAVVLRDGHAWHLLVFGRPWTVHDCSHQAALRGRAGSDGKLRASMNGRVVAVAVAVGDAVAAGAPVVTLEAMKMEHVHVAPVAGRMAALHVSPGEQVAMHRVLAEITPDGAAAA
jgi:geranyl-CoA carboxylase alpha subunit